MRRSNGAGGVFKLSGNRRKPWMARVTVGWNEGKQLFKTIGYFETKAKAEEAIALDRVLPTSEHKNITLADLFKEWTSTRAYTELSRQTQSNYDAAFDRYMTEYHKTKFADLRQQHFQGMIDKAEAMHKSRSTMEKIRVLSTLLSNYAISQDYTIKSYVLGVKLPKTSKKKIVETFSETDIQKMFKRDDIADTLLILIYTGMRIAELLTLTKFNIDIEHMVITGGIKTEAGTDRVIPIHPKIQKYVRARYEMSKNYLIEDENEKRYNYNTYTAKVYYPTLEALELPRLTPHKTRHTFFTLMSAKCEDRYAMALVGGHTDPNFTDSVYVHPDIERLRKAIESI